MRSTSWSEKGNSANHGTEDLLCTTFMRGLVFGENGGPHEIAALETGDRPTGGDLRALADARFDVAHDLRLLLVADQRTHLAGGIEPRRELDISQPLC